jgi:hypothetical protein
VAAAAIWIARTSFQSGWDEVEATAGEFADWILALRGSRIERLPQAGREEAVTAAVGPGSEREPIGEDVASSSQRRRRSAWPRGTRA